MSFLLLQLVSEKTRAGQGLVPSQQVELCNHLFKPQFPHL